MDGAQEWTMAKVVVKFDERILKEYGLEEEVTIGRLPDNRILIDNPAVSAHHARIFRDGERYVVEDLRSKNGTYVNQKHVIRHTLEDGDVVLVGKHKLVFDGAAAASGSVEERVAPTLGPTSYLDTKAHRELLNRLRQERAAKAAPSAPKAEAARGGLQASTAVVRVLAGAATHAEYKLEASTSLIGKSANALVRLRGWFKPKAAAAIVREDRGFALTPMEAQAVVNGNRVHGRRELKNGDVIEIAGIVLEFRLNVAADDDARPRPNVA
jgi:pSer/pThr/pTyr-binding forkhead associated (FHA) protein